MKKLYIVLWKDINGSDMGFLPFSRIPKKSILWKHIREREETVHLENDGVRGFYYKRFLAEEHLKIESKWRTGKEEKFKIIKL